jgi:uncharacterized Zn-finger protein
MPKTHYECIKCNKKLSTKSQLNNHMKNKFGCNKDLSCKRCGIFFKSSYHLHRHLNKKTQCEDILTSMAVEALELDLTDLHI